MFFNLLYDLFSKVQKCFVLNNFARILFSHYLIYLFIYILRECACQDFYSIIPQVLFIVFNIKKY